MKYNLQCMCWKSWLILVSFFMLYCVCLCFIVRILTNVYAFTFVNNISWLFNNNHCSNLCIRIVGSIDIAQSSRQAGRFRYFWLSSIFYCVFVGMWRFGIFIVLVVCIFAFYCLIKFIIFYFRINSDSIR